MGVGVAVVSFPSDSAVAVGVASATAVGVASAVGSVSGTIVASGVPVPSPLSAFVSSEASTVVSGALASCEGSSLTGSSDTGSSEEGSS